MMDPVVRDLIIALTVVLTAIGQSIYLNQHMKTSQSWLRTKIRDDIDNPQSNSNKKDGA